MAPSGTPAFCIRTNGSYSGPIALPAPLELASTGSEASGGINASVSSPLFLLVEFDEDVPVSRDALDLRRDERGREERDVRERLLLEEVFRSPSPPRELLLLLLPLLLVSFDLISLLLSY